MPTSALERIRLLAGHTRPSLAIESGVCARQIERLETGKCAPRYETAVRLARALGYGDDPRVVFPELIHRMGRL